jgi:hypothetical protein
MLRAPLDPSLPRARHECPASGWGFLPAFRGGNMVTMKRAVLVGLMGACLMACGGSRFRAKTTRTVASDGGPAWIADCRDAASCWEVIGYQCPNGYDILDGDSQAVTQTDAQGNVTAWTPNFATANHSERTTRSKSMQLLVRCRAEFRREGIVVK